MRYAEPVTGPVAHHGEGPFWDDRSGRLLCMDVLAAEVVSIYPWGAISRHKVPSRVATVIRRRTRGGFVVATDHGLMVADDELLTFDEIVHLTDDPTVRTNDGGCDPLGGFVIGTMAYDERAGAGTVYRVTPGHGVVRLVPTVSISNGVQWSADGKRVFYVDTSTRRVDVFHTDDRAGLWRDRRPHIELNGSAGYPDGMAIDEEDGLWIAMWGGGAVHHYDSDGLLVEVVRVPGITQVSSCAFGGNQRDVLYITTSRQGLPSEVQPAAGAVFAIQVATCGARVWEFAG